MQADYTCTSHHSISMQPSVRVYLFTCFNCVQWFLSDPKYINRNMGACNKLLTSTELGLEYPWLNTDGLALGSLGKYIVDVYTTLNLFCHSVYFLFYLGLENEGWFDPYLLLSAFKRKIQSLGVHYVNGEVTGLNVTGQSVKTAEVSILLV